MMSFFVHLLLAHHSFGVQFADPPQSSSVEASGSGATIALMRNQRSDLGEVVGGWVGTGGEPALPDEVGMNVEHKHKPEKSDDDPDEATEKSDDKDTSKAEKSKKAVKDSENPLTDLVKSKKATCAPLASHGTYYTVDVS